MIETKIQVAAIRSLKVAAFFFLLIAPAEADEQSGSAVGAKAIKGKSLTIVPWLDFPSTKTTAAIEWRGAPDEPILAVVTFDGKEAKFEDGNFFMILGDYQNSLCRSTLLKITKDVQFPANTADITAMEGGAWVRLIHGSIAGGVNVSVVYAADVHEEPLEFSFPKNESLETSAHLFQSKNANARQSAILCLRWCEVLENREQVVQLLEKGLQDAAPGVRGASGWVKGQLRMKEMLAGLSAALQTEEDEGVKNTMKRAVKLLK